jgi:hypothetical protein
MPLCFWVDEVDGTLHRSRYKRGGVMALKMSPVSRNLHAKVTLLGLELEDMLFLAMACAVAMLVGQFLFSDRYMFFLPMNWFLMLMVLVLGVPGLMLFKYGKPRGYLLDLVLYYGQPRNYCALARDTKLTNSFLKKNE